MAYTVIENFNLGLRRAKSALTSLVGSLWQADDVHVTEGGELEKRKAFVNGGAISTAGIEKTFGLCATSSAIYTFGHAAGVAVATGLTYQRLQHPAVLDKPAVYSSSLHDIKEIVCAFAYNNKPYAIVKFEDNSYYAYYDGSLVGALRNGKVLYGLTSLEDVAEHIKDMIDTVDGITVSKTALTGGDYVVDFYGNPNDTLNVTATENSTYGVLSTIKYSNATPTVPGTAAIGSFEIINGATGGAVTLVEAVTAGGVSTTLYTGSVAWNTDTATTALDVASAINTYLLAQANENYYAEVSGSIVTIRYNLGALTSKVRVTVASGQPLIIGKAGFTVDGAGTDQINSIAVGATQLIAAPVVYATSDNNWASLIAAAINASSATSGYVATTTANKIFIGKRVTTSDDGTITIVVDYTTAAGSVAESAVTGGTATPVPKVYLTSKQLRLGYKFASDRSWSTIYPTTIGMVFSGGTPFTVTSTQPAYIGSWNIVSGPSNGLKWRSNNAALFSYIEPQFYWDFAAAPSIRDGVYRFALELKDSAGIVASTEYLDVFVYKAPEPPRG